MLSCMGGSKVPPYTKMRLDTYTKCYINFCVLYQLPGVLYINLKVEERSRDDGSERSGERKRSTKRGEECAWRQGIVVNMQGEGTNLWQQWC